jgi:S1-C subfamily serine protease
MSMSRASPDRTGLADLGRSAAIVLALLLLQGQVLQIRREMSGSTSGLAQAQAQTSTKLDDTQRYVTLAVEDAAVDLDRAKEAVADFLRTLRHEREDVLRLVAQRTEALETDLKRAMDRGREEFQLVKSVAESNAVRLQSLCDSVDRRPELMKRLMLYPTLQLRGNGTVGSGVLVYSEPQLGVAGEDGAVTLALTAYHVVAEVLGEKLDRPLQDVRLPGTTDAEPIETAYGARVVLHDEGRDLALLRLNTRRRFPHLAELMPEEELARIGVFSPAYAVGCPLGNRPLPTLGEISSTHKPVRGQVFWMLSAPTFFGNSGGGVYSVPGCRLIGVSSMIYTYGKTQPTVVPHMGLFVPLDTVLAWLEREGFGFILRREPVPAALRERLVPAPSEIRLVPRTERGSGGDFEN